MNENWDHNFLIIVRWVGVGALSAEGQNSSKCFSKLPLSAWKRFRNFLICFSQSFPIVEDRNKIGPVGLQKQLCHFTAKKVFGFLFESGRDWRANFWVSQRFIMKKVKMKEIVKYVVFFTNQKGLVKS